MDDYISREAVSRYLKGYSEKECNSDSPYGMITSRVLDKAERAISEMPAADVQSDKRWISVEDKLPIEYGPVLCYARSTSGEGNLCIMGVLRMGEFWFLQVHGPQLSFPQLQLKVTHWMPIPDPPKGGKT